jgi:hypothetical protein
MKNTITYTVATQLLNEHCEALVWNDGHVEIEDPARNFQDEPALPNITLDKEQALALRTWLNSLDLDS